MERKHGYRADAGITFDCRDDAGWPRLWPIWFGEGTTQHCGMVSVWPNRRLLTYLLLALKALPILQAGSDCGSQSSLPVLLMFFPSSVVSEESQSFGSARDKKQYCRADAALDFGPRSLERPNKNTHAGCLGILYDLRFDKRLGKRRGSIIVLSFLADCHHSGEDPPGRSLLHGVTMHSGYQNRSGRESQVQGSRADQNPLKCFSDNRDSIE